jgi:hypothetical protein
MIKAKEAATVLVTAAVTMAVVVVLLWPMGMGAAEQLAAPRVLLPTMTFGTCRFTMETAQPSTEPGAKPSVTLKVVNTGQTAAEAAVWVVVSATRPESMMSRVPVMPRTVWTHKCTVSLAAGATQTLTVPIEAQLPEGQSIMISMTDPDQEPVVLPSPRVQAGAAGTQASQTAAPKPAK